MTPASVLHRPDGTGFPRRVRLGDDDKRINTLDTDGVTMAAVQGLYQELQDEKARNTELEKRLERMEKQMQAVSYQLRELQTAPQPA